MGTHDKIFLGILMIIALAGFVCAEGIDENTVLMLHMDDVGLTDNSDSPHTVTLNDNAALNTGSYKFGSGSAYFDGTGDYLSIPDSDDFDFGTDDFTIDAWIYPTNVVDEYNMILSMYQVGLYNDVYLSLSGNYLQWYDSAGVYQGTGITVSPNTWHHVAVVRSSNILKLFINGVESYELSNNENIINGALRIGAWEDSDLYEFNGYIDELRISKGIARWTSDFIPPTEPYSAPAPAPFSCGDTVSYEGQNYNTVQIGEQCWFAENLNVGTKVTGVTEQTNNAVIEKYCYDNLDANCNTDGGLYQWDEAMQYVTTECAQGICPDGWHIPTDAEWYTLENGLTNGTCNATRHAVWDCDLTGDVLKKFGLCQGRTPCGTSGFDALVHGYYSNTFVQRDLYTIFWSSNEYSADYTWDRRLHLTTLGVYRDPNLKDAGFSVRCLIDSLTTPTSSNFTSEETTNFSAVEDITAVVNLTLATDKGKIRFAQESIVNAEAQDYDTNIIIEDEFISVNTAALDESFNSSATITLEGVSCPVETITYQEGTFTSKDDIISGGSNCELDGVCSNIQCSDSTLTFDVAHFTGFAAGADANLTIQAQAGVFYPLEPIEFTAEYINSTDGTPISGECNITFDDDTEYTMDFDTDYNYTKAFATAGTHEYNVTCSSADFVTLEANDTKLVSSVDIPEFSILTLGLGLIAVLIGLFVIRKKSY